MNPLFDRKRFMADPEAHKMPDGRLYVYGSHDKCGAKEYCSLYHYVLSTDDPKLEKWTDYGVVFQNTPEKTQVGWRETGRLSAPDAIHKDGKYYLYVCSSMSRIEGVAESDKPYGPFENCVAVPYADGDGIDPAVFVDDDGSAYLFWGQFNLRGAKLNPDMKTLDLSTVNRSIINEFEHGFHEGASIRKRGDKYYLVYVDISRGKPTCLSYAISNNPLGPYEKKGVIIDTTFCDQGVWNNHGSIEEYKGQWYVFYHRSSQGDRYSRRTCAEKIYFNEDGTINEVEMTSQGASDPINAFEWIDATIACRIRGNCYVALSNEGMNGEILSGCGGGNWIDAWAEYKYLNFHEGASKIVVKAKGEGIIKVCTVGSKELGRVQIDCENFSEFTFDIQRIAGVQPLWLTFEIKKQDLYTDKDLGMDVHSFKFIKGDK